MGLFTKRCSVDGLGLISDVESMLELRMEASRLTASANSSIVEIAICFCFISYEPLTVLQSILDRVLSSLDQCWFSEMFDGAAIGLM